MLLLLLIFLIKIKYLYFLNVKVKNYNDGQLMSKVLNQLRDNIFVKTDSTVEFKAYYGSDLIHFHEK